MTRTMSIILGLLFVGLGVLGVTGNLALINIQQSTIYIAEIVIGALGILAGIYAHSRRENPSNTSVLKENDKLKQTNFDQQRSENTQLKEEITLLKKQNYDQVQKVSDQTQEANERLQRENDQLKKDIA